jgi:hypothetical protein
MIPRMPKPGGSTLVQQSGSAHDLPAPGKRALTEQIAPVAPVQRSPAHQSHGPQTATSGEHTPKIAQPEPGIDQTGFIDNSKGAPLYNRPPEAGGDLVRDTPLPPASRVFASGMYPKLKDWWYVTAFVEGTMLRGYVEAHRINAHLPEPFAELRQLEGGETPEGLAKEKYGKDVRDGHDLRYYENVLLYVNRGRDGIAGTYQDPSVLGGGANNIKLYAGHRIWLVSPDYAKALEGVVPSGSLTGGAVAKVKRFGAHLQDILQSVTESRNHFGEVAGEFAQAIRDHLPAIVGITAGFLTLEAASMFLAATPTGVGQAAAAVIQLALSAFGAASMVEAGVEALKHGSAWLTTAWTAHGKLELIAEASKEFLRMLVAIAVAALGYLGAKGNYKNALKIANNMPTGSLPAFATAGHAPSGGAGAAAGVAIGPSAGGPAVVGAAAVGLSDKEKAAHGKGQEVDGAHDKDVGEARSSERHDPRGADGRENTTPGEHAAHHQPAQSVVPKHYSLKPSDVEQAAQTMKASRRLQGDMAVFDKLVEQAKAGQAGSLGELEAIQRWLDNGSAVEVLPEHQNQLNASGKPRTNPDYRVDGKLREVKSRSDTLDNEWVKENVTKANKQIKNSGLSEQGEAELQLRGPEAEHATLAQVERQVKGNFSTQFGRHLRRVAVYKNGVLFAEWERLPDGTILRTFPL